MHGLLPGGAQALEALRPGFADGLVGAGAMPIDAWPREVLWLNPAGARRCPTGSSGWGAPPPGARPASTPTLAYATRQYRRPAVDPGFKAIFVEGAPGQTRMGVMFPIEGERLISPCRASATTAGRPTPTASTGSWPRCARA